MLGAFVVGWSVFESVLDVAISRQLKITDEQGLIVTSGLAFERKLQILIALLSLEKDEHRSTISSLKRIKKVAARNLLLHGNIWIGDDHLHFVQVLTDDGLKAREIKHNVKNFATSIQEIMQLVESVKSALSITDDDRSRFGALGKKLAREATEARDRRATTG